MDPQLRDPSMGAALKEELARPAAASMEINENSGERRGFARAGGAGAGTGTGVGVKAGAGGSRSHGSLRAHPGRAGARAAPARPPGAGSAAPTLTILTIFPPRPQNSR